MILSILMIYVSTVLTKLYLMPYSIRWKPSEADKLLRLIVK